MGEVRATEVGYHEDFGAFCEKVCAAEGHLGMSSVTAMASVEQPGMVEVRETWCFPGRWVPWKLGEDHLA
jgi:hypothetical protein